MSSMWIAGAPLGARVPVIVDSMKLGSYDDGDDEVDQSTKAPVVALEFSELVKTNQARLVFALPSQQNEQRRFLRISRERGFEVLAKWPTLGNCIVDGYVV
ncbi:hypothetical protein ACOME3_006965 [Neoechinorhynchus agilis]